MTSSDCPELCQRPCSLVWTLSHFLRNRAVSELSILTTQPEKSHMMDLGWQRGVKGEAKICKKICSCMSYVGRETQSVMSDLEGTINRDFCKSLKGPISKSPGLFEHWPPTQMWIMSANLRGVNTWHLMWLHDPRPESGSDVAQIYWTD